MNIEKFKQAVAKLEFQCRENEPMRKHTTFLIGGNADLMVDVDDVSKLAEVFLAAKEFDIPLTVIGNGSNLLVSDKGIEGAVIRICDETIEVCGNRIKCAAGAKLSRVSAVARDNSLGKMEFAWGIPGTVGGAVYMNAGAYGGEIKQVIVSCTSLTTDGRIITRLANELELGYRTSIFKKNDEIILSAEFLLEKADKSTIAAIMDDYMARRKSKQPLELASAGSTFKRPEGYFAGALIEQCGLKGFKIGDAAVSEKHAGFVVNLGNATCDDVQKLIKRIQETVKEATDVELEPEVIFKGR